MNPVDEYVSREHRFSIGVGSISGDAYVSFPVSNGAADYEEFYRLTAAQHDQFIARPGLAVAFVQQCRARENDHLLMQQPGTNRGTPT